MVAKKKVGKIELTKVENKEEIKNAFDMEKSKMDRLAASAHNFLFIANHGKKLGLCMFVPTPSIPAYIQALEETVKILKKVQANG